jgi:hypothetical protein
MRIGQKFVTFGLAAWGTVATAALVMEWNEIQRLNLRSIASAQTVVRRTAQRNVLEKRVQAAEGKAKELQALFDRGARRLDAKESEVGKANPAVEDGAKGAVELVHNWLALVNDPQVTRLLNVHERAQIQRRYGTMFKQLGLSPDQSDALAQLMIDKKQAAMDVAIASVQQGDDPLLDPNGFGDLVAAMRSQIDGQIKSLLGDTGYAQFQGFDRSAGQLGVIAQLQQMLSSTDAPLTNDQANQLQQVMEQNHVGHLNAKVVAGAQTILAPDQTPMLQALLAERQAAAQRKAIQEGAMQNLGVPVAPTSSGH